MTKAKATESKRGIAWGRWILLLFVAVWMFVLGVLVGRVKAPVVFDTQALDKELASLRDTLLKKEREAAENAILDENHSTHLEFYEALKKDEPDTAVQIDEARAATTEMSGSTTHSAASTPPHKRRSAMLTKKAAERTRPQQRTKPSAPQATAGHLTIQVASLKDVTAAERIVATLKQAGFPAYLSKTVIPGKGHWFRARVGSYQTREQALAVMNRLKQNQHEPILVTK